MLLYACYVSFFIVFIFFGSVFSSHPSLAGIQGKPLQLCMEAGHYAASQVIQVSGVVYHGKPHFPPGEHTRTYTFLFLTIIQYS